MEKEIFTKEKCKIDLMATLKHEFLNHLIYVIPYSVLANFVAALLYYYRPGKANPILFYVTIPITIILICWLIYDLISKIYMISNEKFTIVKDKLVNTGYGERFLNTRLDSLHYLCFYNYGKYYLAFDYYKWSKNYCNYCGRVLHNRSVIGDEFYIVSYNKSTIPKVVYNTKIFEFKDE